jgi:predicted component of type VI protein secretion system
MTEPIKSILLKDASGAERLIPLDQPVLTVGREITCSIRLDSPYVSRQHARIEQQDGGVMLVDLGSRNGSLLNGERVEGSAPLSPGDVVTIADATLECLAESASDGTTRTFALPRARATPDTLVVDSQTYEVTVGGKPLERRLSAQEFELLSYLYTNRERVCQRQELGDAIWGPGNWDPNMLHRLVHRLKEKIEPAPEKPRYIQTVPWVGYRLNE